MPYQPTVQKIHHTLYIDSLVMEDTLLSKTVTIQTL